MLEKLNKIVPFLIFSILISVTLYIYHSTYQVELKRPLENHFLEKILKS